MPRLWILGAPDPEMEMIESLLRAQGEAVTYALRDGQRVHPGNAYRAISGGGPYGLADDHRDTLVLVECDYQDLELSWRTIHIDHHHLGDPGYGRPPIEFMEASSLGQVLRLIHGGIWYWNQDLCSDSVLNIDGDWELRSDLEHPNWVPGHYIAPTKVVLCAAADHCLTAAYRGECQGVDPEALMSWRAETRAKYQHRPVEAVLADVDAARNILRSAVSGLQDLPLPEGVSVGMSVGRPIVEFRETIPELPEAAAREGIAIQATLDERGRKKVVLQVASPEQIAAFLQREDLQDKYGDPARGFAGGYI